MDILIYFILYIVDGLIFGFVCRAIVAGKGYTSENGYTNHGFAWGFWLGIIGVIVCACKREIPMTYEEKENSITDKADVISMDLESNGFWKCPNCGKLYSKYATECECGYVKPVDIDVSDENKRIEQLKQYKELLDNGAITEEEYDEVKGRILG